MAVVLPSPTKPSIWPPSWHFQSLKHEAIGPSPWPLPYVKFSPFSTLVSWSFSRSNTSASIEQSLMILQKDRYSYKDAGTSRQAQSTLNSKVENDSREMTWVKLRRQLSAKFLLGFLIEPSFKSHVGACEVLPTRSRTLTKSKSSLSCLRRKSMTLAFSVLLPIHSNFFSPLKCLWKTTMNLLAIRPEREFWRFPWDWILWYWWSEELKVTGWTTSFIFFLGC